MGTAHSALRHAGDSLPGEVPPGLVIGYVDGRERKFRLLPGAGGRYHGGMLNHDQMLCLWGGIGVAVLMGLCPPWSDYGEFTGYGALWSPPNSRSSISVVRLLLQWVILTGVTYAAILWVPQVRYRARYFAPSGSAVMPEPSGVGDAIGGTFKRIGQ